MDSNIIYLPCCLCAATAAFGDRAQSFDGLSGRAAAWNQHNSKQAAASCHGCGFCASHADCACSCCCTCWRRSKKVRERGATKSCRCSIKFSRRLLARSLKFWYQQILWLYNVACTAERCCISWNAIHCVFFNVTDCPKPLVPLTAEFTKRFPDVVQNRVHYFGITLTDAVIFNTR